MRSLDQGLLSCLSNRYTWLFGLNQSTLTASAAGKRGLAACSIRTADSRLFSFSDAGGRSHHGVGRVLEHNHGEFAVGRNHDLVDGRADFDECDVFFGVQRLDRVRRLFQELMDQSAVVDRLLLIHGAFDGDSLFVDNDDTEHAHVRVDSVERFFYLLGRCHGFGWRLRCFCKFKIILSNSH